MQVVVGSEMPMIARWYQTAGPMIAAARKRILWRVESIADPLRLRRIDLSKCLMGGEAGIPADKYARISNDLLRASTPLIESPHVKLLRQYEAVGEALFESDMLRATEYFKNALRCIDLTGAYFEARREDQIPIVVRRFIDSFRGIRRPLAAGQSEPGEHVTVAPIRDSKWCQMIDGHHRAAMSLVRGETSVLGLRTRHSVETPLQSLLSDVMWLKGRRELYQPIEAPELDGWRLVRRCSDRLEKMRLFLNEYRAAGAELRNYIDIGSSYGWFVANMSKLGLDTYGVEQDPIAGSVGVLVYGLRQEQITRSECVRFLQSERAPYDVVSCLSVVHHFIMGNGGIGGEDLIRLVDRLTGKVLFFEMGEEHEGWYRDELRGWNPDRIETWLRANTTFRKITRLGVDEDAGGAFNGNLGRMLFACTR